MKSRSIRTLATGFVLVAICLPSCKPSGSSNAAWRSALYPSGWTPGHTDSSGRFLHDFSWAGYHNGERAIPEVTGKKFDVVAHGADPAGNVDSTAAFQRAIDQAEGEGGGIVFIPAGLYRIEGTLRVEASGVVVRGEGASRSRLLFTRHSGMDHKSHLTFAGTIRRDGDLPLAEDGRNRSSSVRLTRIDGLAVGDTIAVGCVITDDFRNDHGMSQYWSSFAAGQWKAFARRRIVAIDPNTNRVTFDVPLRYPLKTRDRASVREERGYLTEVGLEKCGVSNAVSRSDAWKTDQIHAVEMSGVADGWVREVDSFASGLSGSQGDHLASGGILVRHSKRVTVADCRMERAQNRGGGGNGYLFEIRTSNEVLIRDCTASKGRHNFVQNWDFGTSGCVFLRTHSSGGRVLAGSWDPIGVVGASEYHHALATANLVDDSVVDDGWSAINRRQYSSGAGHTASQCVFWNMRGKGFVRSAQVGWGYVIGTGTDLRVDVTPLIGASGTGPTDFLEGEGKGSSLTPASLYDDQLNRRLGR